MKKLLILLGVLGVSLSAPFVRISDAPSMVLVLYRVAIAALLLLPWALLRKLAAVLSKIIVTPITMTVNFLVMKAVIEKL